MSPNKIVRGEVWQCVSTLLPPEVHEAMKQHLNEDDRSVSAYLRMLVRKDLKEKGKCQS